MFQEHAASLPPGAMAFSPCVIDDAMLIEEGYADLMVAIHGRGWEPNAPGRAEEREAGDPVLIMKEKEDDMAEGCLVEPPRMSACWQMRDKGRCDRLNCRFDHDSEKPWEGARRKDKKASLPHSPTSAVCR